MLAWTRMPEGTPSISQLREELEQTKGQMFKPIVGTEAYCARRTLYDKDKNPLYKLVGEKYVLAKYKDYQADKTMFDTVKAWRDGEVYLEMAYNAYYTNYEIALANTWFIAKTVYPSLFEDIDMTAKTNEITQAFYGMDLADAIFAFPQSFGGYQKIDTATFFE